MFFNLYVKSSIHPSIYLCVFAKDYYLINTNTITITYKGQAKDQSKK